MNPAVCCLFVCVRFWHGCLSFVSSTELWVIIGVREACKRLSAIGLESRQAVLVSVFPQRHNGIELAQNDQKDPLLEEPGSQHQGTC